MEGLFKILVLLGGAAAAVAVAAMCAVCLFVWVAGLHSMTASEAWRPADES